MWNNFIHELTRAAEEIVQGFARFLPRVLEMLVIVLVGWVMAILLRAVARSILKIARFDKLSEHTGATQLLRGAALPSLTELVSRFVFWIACPSLDPNNFPTVVAPNISGETHQYQPGVRASRHFSGST